MLFFMGYDDTYGHQLWKTGLAPSLTAKLANGNLTITERFGAENDITLGRSGNQLFIADAHVPFESAPPGGSLANHNQTLIMPFDSITGSLILQTGVGNDTM